MRFCASPRRHTLGTAVAVSAPDVAPRAATIGSLLSALVHQLAEWDRVLLEAGQNLRWEPLTALFVIASTWWVKWPLFAAAGALCDASRRRFLPRAQMSWPGR